MFSSGRFPYKCALSTDDGGNNKSDSVWLSTCYCEMILLKLLFFALTITVDARTNAYVTSPLLSMGLQHITGLDFQLSARILRVPSVKICYLSYF